MLKTKQQHQPAPPLPTNSPRPPKAPFWVGKWLCQYLKDIGWKLFAKIELNIFLWNIEPTFPLGTLKYKSIGKRKMGKVTGVKEEILQGEEWKETVVPYFL